MKFNVTVTKDIIVEFDENSAEFKELWEGYKYAIDSTATYQSFAEDIASMISRYGVRDAIEGVGIVEHNGEPYHQYFPKEKIHHNPVNVEVDTDLNNMVDFDIDYTDEIK